MQLCSYAWPCKFRPGATVLSRWKNFLCAYCDYALTRWCTYRGSTVSRSFHRRNENGISLVMNTLSIAPSRIEKFKKLKVVSWVLSVGTAVRSWLSNMYAISTDQCCIVSRIYCRASCDKGLQCGLEAQTRTSRVSCSLKRDPVPPPVRSSEDGHAGRQLNKVH